MIHQDYSKQYAVNFQFFGTTLVTRSIPHDPQRLTIKFIDSVAVFPCKNLWRPVSHVSHYTRNLAG